MSEDDALSLMVKAKQDQQDGSLLRSTSTNYC